MNKKSYNPFKMWGSWFGFVFGWFWMFMESIRLGGNDPFIAERILPAGGDMRYLFIYLLIYMISGFVIGWAIHSLIRKFRN